jgi:hypothetical protein
MAMPTAQQASQAWQRGLQGATEKIKQGVMAVTVAPTQLAAAQQNAYLQGVQRAVDSGKYAAGLRRVSLTDWQNATITKGVGRIASGATAALPKFESFMNQFLPHLQAGVNALQNMPRGDLNQNIARAVAMIEHNARFRRTS